MGSLSGWQFPYLRDRRTLYIVLTLPVVAVAAARYAVSLVPSHSYSKTKVIPSPRRSLELLEGKDLDELPYPSDALPGCRDVDTPYGNIRVYEWGPETGRKVLCIQSVFRRLSPTLETTQNIMRYLEIYLYSMLTLV